MVRVKNKNTFRPEQFEYAPRQQQNQPLWLHSVQCSRTSRTTIGEVLVLIGIFAAIAVTWSILG